MVDIFNLFYPVCSDVQSCQLFLKKNREGKMKDLYIIALKYSGTDKNKTTVRCDDRSEHKESPCGVKVQGRVTEHQKSWRNGKIKH